MVPAGLSGASRFSMLISSAAPTNEMPKWSEFEWRIARAAAAMHGISSLLHRDLRWRGPKAGSAIKFISQGRKRIRRQDWASM